MSDAPPPTPADQPQLPPQPPQKKGMSVGCIIALCVVPFLLITVIAILASIAVPAYNGIKTKAQEAKAEATVQSGFFALDRYASDHSQKAPADIQELVDKQYLDGSLLSGPSAPILELLVPGGSELRNLEPSTPLLRATVGEKAIAEAYSDGTTEVIRPSSSPRGP